MLNLLPEVPPEFAAVSVVPLLPPSKLLDSKAVPPLEPACVVTSVLGDGALFPDPFVAMIS